MSAGPKIAFDIGGTFTDVVLATPRGNLTAKVLTTPDAPDVGAMRGILGLIAESGLAPQELTLLVHGTTLATNAIIERKGAATALVTTAGFRDSLEIAYENRFDQYNLFMEKPAPLVPRHLRFGVPERMNANGGVELDLDERALLTLADELRQKAIESVAVAFLHSYANPSHEIAATALLERELPGVSFTRSSQVCPEIREYERISTAVANAYVQPLMSSYLTTLRDRLADAGIGCPKFLMTSSGGLTTFEQAVRFPIRLVESGPAGGAIMAASVAAECGLEKVLSFDMGGTTAKICLIDDAIPLKSRHFEVDRRYRFAKGSGLPIRVPVIEMVEIGAGGGSVASVDSASRIAVGPDSAGAAPGPACYGLGGHRPTVTDADLVLGRIGHQGFAGGQIALKPALAERALRTTIGEPLGIDVTMAAQAVAELVEENMASAARIHTIERGKNFDDRVMIAFGGAAPVHATRVAEKLGIGRLVIPAAAGVGSAVGFLKAPISFESVCSLYMRLSDFDAGAVNAMLRELAGSARKEVLKGAADAGLVEFRQADMRYRGQGHEVPIALPARDFEATDAAFLVAAFEAAYSAIYGRTIPGLDVEVLTWTVGISTRQAKPQPLPASVRPNLAAEPTGVRRLNDTQRNRFDDVPLYARASLGADRFVSGPAIIAEDQTTTLVTGSYDAWVDARGNLRLQHKGLA